MSKIEKPQNKTFNEFFDKNNLKYNFHGTGSYPHSLNGLHFKIRLIAKKEPLKKPYFFIASNA